MRDDGSEFGHIWPYRIRFSTVLVNEQTIDSRYIADVYT
jgi:hypothetical protein